MGAGPSISSLGKRRAKARRLAISGQVVVRSTAG